jgi:hypothetical protein
MHHRRVALQRDLVRSPLHATRFSSSLFPLTALTAMSALTAMTALPMTAMAAFLTLDFGIYVHPHNLGLCLT